MRSEEHSVPACRWRAGTATLILALLGLSEAFSQQCLSDPIVNGQAVVRLQPGTDVGAYNARHGTAIVRDVASRDLYLLQLPEGVDEETFVDAELKTDPDTLFVELNYTGAAPEGRAIQFFFNIKKTNGAFMTQPAWGQVNIAGAQQFTLGTGTSIALLDTGIDATHEFLAGKVLDTGYNFIALNNNTADIALGVDNDGDTYLDEMTGHGTHMAGIVAYVAPEAKLLPIKVLDSEGNGDNFILAQGMFYAIDQNVDVMNISVGSTYDSKAIETAIDEAQTKGIVVVAASGNCNRATPQEYPALNEGTIGIAAVDGGDIKAGFSNYNSLVALSAPGAEIYSTLPDNQYGAVDGTSPSTPLVAGTAALLLAANPEWPRNAARTGLVNAHLRQGAANIDALNPDYAGQLGAGRLDAGAALSAQIVLDGPTEYPVGTLPSGVCAGDFNGDQWPDIAVSNAGSNSVSILLNDGTGNLLDDLQYTAGTVPEAVVCGDFDRDDDLDLALANSGSNRVSILKNRGDGSFTSPTTVNVGGEPVALVTGDFDGDRDLDLAVVNSDDNTVSILRNNGSGTFSSIGTIAVEDSPESISAGDIDGDQDIDLAIANRKSDSISILKNGGSADFSVLKQVGTGAGPRDAALVDLDGDGVLELVSSNHDAGELQVFENNGSGTFTSKRNLPIGGGRKPNRLIAFDSNCDGQPDLAATNNSDVEDVVTLFINLGDLAFDDAVDFPSGKNSKALAAADLDRDGDADLAIVAQDADTVGVFTNQSCPGPIHGDLNCDGTVDFNDIDAFVLQLTDPAEYRAQYPLCNPYNGDTNGDFSTDFDDIDGFVACLVNGGCP